MGEAMRAPRRGRWFIGGAVGLLVALAIALGIGVVLRRHLVPAAPPHAAAQAQIPAITSTIAVPVYADLASLQRLLDQQVPRQLWTIDKPGVTCVGPQRVHLFGARIAITPKLKCEIAGTATRGAIVLRGAGREIIADIPVHAELHAQHVGGIASATATGDAMVHAHIALAVARDWQVSGRVRLTHDWTTPPGIDILGNRVTFTDKADAKLRPVAAKLERKLPAELAKLDVRAHVADIWAKAFTVVSLNGDNPPVWLRVVPQRLSYGGYAIVGHQLRLDLGLMGLTQAVVGHRPADPVPAPLPDMAPQPPQTGLVRVFVPVVADYAQIVPVIAKALAKREQRPFDLPGTGAVMVHFDHIAAYGAPGGKIAVGADIATWPVQGPGAAHLVGATSGRIWFVARPVNAPGSQLVHFTELAVNGRTDSAGSDLALAIANSPGFSDVMAGALTQNFARDFQKLLGKIHKAIAHKRLGDFVIAARVARVRNGQLAAYANGLYLPVWLEGPASVTFDKR